MAIEIPMNPGAVRLPALLKDSPATLQLNQKIAVKVLTSDILKNSLALQLGEKTLQVHADRTFQSSALPAAGTALKLQVVKLTPTLEFKILSGALESASFKPIPAGNNPPLPAQAQRPAFQELRLILNTPEPLPTAPAQPSVKPESTDAGSMHVSTNPAKPPSPVLNTSLTLSSPADMTKLFGAGQLLNVKIIAINAGIIHLQILNDPVAANPSTRPDKPTGNLSSTDASTTINTALDPLKTELPSAKPVVTIALNQLKIPANALTTSPGEPNNRIALPDLQLQTGQNLKLEVGKIGEQFEFKILKFGQAAQQTLNITDTVRQLLPQQVAPELLVNRLIRQLPTLRENETISGALKRIAQEIIQNLPKEQQLTNPQTLKQSAMQSGIFLEAKLAQLATGSPPELHTDFKLSLLRLLNEFNEQLTKTAHAATSESKPAQDLNSNVLNVLKELHQKTEGSLAKLILDQLSSLSKEDSPKQMWNFEIPFLNKGTADKIDFEIEQDQGHSDDPSIPPSWSVTITLTPPHLGTFHCKITYLENTINTYFRSEHPQTLALLDAHLETLRRQFEAAGLTPGFMNTQEGHFKKSIRQKIAFEALFNDKA